MLQEECQQHAERTFKQRLRLPQSLSIKQQAIVCWIERFHTAVHAQCQWLLTLISKAWGSIPCAFPVKLNDCCTSSACTLIKIMNMPGYCGLEVSVPTIWLSGNSPAHANR